MTDVSAAQSVRINNCLKFVAECEAAGSIEHAVAFEIVNILSALSAGGEENVQSISAQDPMVIIAGIRQFGLASDGSDLRDLTAALSPAAPPEGVRDRTRLPDQYDHGFAAGRKFEQQRQIELTLSSPPAATIGDIPSEPRPPASAATGLSAGGEAAHQQEKCRLPY